jgi:hypothetical protein
MDQNKVTSTEEFLDELKQNEQTIAQKEAELNVLRARNAEKLAQLNAANALKASEKKLRKITAAEARAIVESSNATLKHIYKNIEEEAKENRVFTIWSFYGQDEASISKVTEILRADGYTVTELELPEDSADKEIKISW